MIPDLLRHPPGGKPWLLYGALAASFLTNLVLAARLSARPDEAVATPVAAAEGVAPSLLQGAVAIPIVGEPSAVSNPPIPPELVQPLPDRSGVAQKAGTMRFTGVVQSSISATFQEAEGTSPAALSAVYSRLFVWDVDLRRDLHKGDRIDVLYKQQNAQEPQILAARLTLQPGQDDERKVETVRFTAPGDRFASWWAPNGVEMERRLIDGPLEDYEQIATLLSQRPSHGGMDFKTPIGTPVTLPRAGKVTRVDFDVPVNGSCVEVRYSDGVVARFLHLNEVLVKPGVAVSAGTVLGKSGNTGRSVAAHLHYELERGGKVLDPVDYHGVLQRHIQPEALPRFQEEAAQLLVQLDGAVAAM